MVIYSLQALCLGVLLLCLSQSRQRMDLFLRVYVGIWTIGVIALFWKFGTSQDTFYSNDQQIQVQMVDRVVLDGVQFSLDEIIGKRYVVTIPASLLTRFGIDALLALKFLQAIFFILTYRLVREHFRIENLKFKMWYLVLFSGPLFVLMSLLGLRDLALAYFAITLMIGRDVRMCAVSWLGLFLLRPHLGVALVFGWLFGFVFDKVRVNFRLLFLLPIVAISFVSGTYAYVIGRHFQFNKPLNFDSLSHLWSQSAFIRLFANFGGLQFLLFGPEIVNLSILKLFLLRLIFFDTFLIPILFVWTIISTSGLQKHTINILASFAFFLGLVSITEFNSSRQNMPFLVLMGVTVIMHLSRRNQFESGPRRAKSMGDRVASVPSIRGH